MRSLRARLVRPLLQRLLGMTRIVRDLNAATAAWRESHGAFHYVTLAGELLSRHGIYTGGYYNGNGDGKAPASILGRKNQIAELSAALAALQEQVAEVSRRKGALQSEQTELQASLQQAQTELRAQEVAIATHEGEFNALQNSRRLLHQKIDTVVYEVQSLAAQEQEGLQKARGARRQGRRTGSPRAGAASRGRGADREIGELAPAARRRQRRADRKQSGAGDRGADVRLVPAAAAIAWSSAFAN